MSQGPTCGWERSDGVIEIGDLSRNIIEVSLNLGDRSFGVRGGNAGNDERGKDKKCGIELDHCERRLGRVQGGRQ